MMYIELIMLLIVVGSGPAAETPAPGAQTLLPAQVIQSAPDCYEYYTDMLSWLKSAREFLIFDPSNNTTGFVSP